MALRKIPIAVVAKIVERGVSTLLLARNKQVSPKKQASGSPDLDLPLKALGFRVQLDGMNKHQDLFTERQLLGLATV